MNNFTKPHFVDSIRQAAPYINKHRQQTVVIALGGEAIASDALAGIVYDIALLKSLGINIAVVFGVRPQLNAALAQGRIKSTYTINNQRVTTAAMMAQLWAVCGQVGTQLQAAFSSGRPDSPLHGARIDTAITNAVTARPIGVLAGIDYQHTGAVRKVNAALLGNTLHNRQLALIPPLGYSLTGETFNLEYLDLAEKTAVALQADKLIIYSKHNGIVDNNKQCLREITCTDASTVKPVSNTQKKILEVAVAVCQQGVGRTHVIGYPIDGSLLKELLTRDGCGSLITAESYDQLRPATINDISGIMALIAPLEANGTLVKRSRDVLEADINNFTVIARDNHIIACAALYLFNNDNAAELGCIVSQADFKGEGLGERLLAAATTRARAAGAKTLFALTTQTTHWFLQQGFKPSSVAALPADKQLLYNFQRASKVLALPL